MSPTATPIYTAGNNWTQ